MNLTHDFLDVIPVKINEEEPQLCQILYSDEYKETMGLLLALLQKKEYSERALELTQEGIELLASHYTIWNYRYNILLRLNKDLFEELDWCEQLALENEKNYQIWNYRQLIIERILELELEDDTRTKKFNPYHEYPILAAMLGEDSKNHHVWSYRKWLVERFQLYNDEREILFVDNCLNEDLRNNSAWTHRYFIKFGNQDENKDDINVKIDKEISFAMEAIKVSPQNPSSWNYLIGIYRKFKKSLIELELFCLQFADININEQTEDVIKSTFALELLAKIFLEKKETLTALEIFKLLEDKYDPIRKNYWQYERSKLEV